MAVANFSGFGFLCIVLSSIVALPTLTSGQGENEIFNKGEPSKDNTILLWFQKFVNILKLVGISAAAFLIFACIGPVLIYIVLHLVGFTLWGKML